MADGDSFLGGEEGIGREDEEEDDIPAERDERVSVIEMAEVPFAFDRPGEGERDGRNPARARDDPEPEQHDREQQRDGKDSGRRADRQLRDQHEQQHERHRGGDRRDVAARDRLRRGRGCRLRKVDAAGEENAEDRDDDEDPTTLS